MKYICLGYLESGKFEGMTEDERNAVLDECFEHNDHLRASLAHIVAEVPLQSMREHRVDPVLGRFNFDRRHLMRRPRNRSAEFRSLRREI